MNDYPAAIQPSVEAIEQFVGACLSMLDRFPEGASVSKACPAMEDFLHQSTYKGEPGEQPIENVLSMIGLFARLGLDSLRSFAILVKADPVLIWGHLLSARASLESLAYCRWLAACPLDRDVRVRRGLLMRLRDAKELGRYNDPQMRQRSLDYKASVWSFAEANGWEVSFSQDSIAGEQLITTKVAIDLALGGDGDGEGVGPKLWSYLSGASHGYPYALLNSADRTNATHDGPSVKVPLVVESNSIHRLVAALLLAGMSAWDAYRLYFGWDDEEWMGDVVPVRQRMVTLATWLQSIEAGSSG
jgi:hypothetical protein